MVRMIQFLRLMQLISRAIRMFLPWVMRSFMFMLGLIATTVISFWAGVPRNVDRMANQWLDRAVIAGFPTEWDRYLYFVLWGLAFCMILIGWVILSYLTVLFVGHIL